MVQYLQKYNKLILFCGHGSNILLILYCFRSCTLRQAQGERKREKAARGELVESIAAPNCKLQQSKLIRMSNIITAEDILITKRGLNHNPRSRIV